MKKIMSILIVGALFAFYGCTTSSDPQKVQTRKGEKIIEKAPFGCKSIVAMAKTWVVPIR